MPDLEFSLNIQNRWLRSNEFDTVRFSREYRGSMQHIDDLPIPGREAFRAARKEAARRSVLPKARLDYAGRKFRA